MKKTTIRKLHVSASHAISPNMQRITLTGQDLASFPSQQEGTYIKLNFPHSDQDALVFQDNQLISKTHIKPLVRTYTIRKQNSELNEIEVDFVLHEAHAGPASSWAKAACIGDELFITGPGPKKAINEQVDWFFIAGDMTALPAISIILENLPSDAIGQAVLEINTEADQIELAHPKGLNIHWVVQASANKEPEGDSDETDILSKTVKELAFLKGTPYVWVACEFNSMKTLRHYFKKEHNIAKEYIYISSYWKRGLSEDRHKIAKREDSNAALNAEGSTLQKAAQTIKKPLS